MTRPKALMAALHDWYSPLALGSHHLARGLVRAGWDVAYFSNGISLGQALKDRVELCRRLGHYSPNGRRAMDGHLWSYVPLGLVTPHNAPLLRSRLVHRHWQSLAFPTPTSAARSLGFDAVDLLYLDTPLQSFWLDAVSHGTSVARIMDRSSGFHGVADEFLVMEQEMIQAVDLVVYAARSLADEMVSSGARRTLHLPNGVDFRHFADGDRTEPPEYASMAGPRAVYIGDIAPWFDFRAVDVMTEQLPAVSFVFIGPDRLARERLAMRPNVHILGVKPFAVLPAYLHNADVGLIPFDVQGFPDAVNAVHPLKLYEYMACGLPVVATRWQELEALDSPAMLCDGAEDFVGAIRSALSDEAERESRVDFARRADWSGRVETLIKASAAVVQAR